MHKRGFTSVEIPNTVTSIGANEFSGCDDMEYITIPNSVKSIDMCAFYGCEELRHIAIPDSVTSIGDRAFYGCRELSSITITGSNEKRDFCAYLPASLISIGNEAFRGCRYLCSVHLPDSLESIGDMAFYESGLSAIGKIPNSLKTIGEKAFWGCKGIKHDIILPHSLVSIGYMAFSGCRPEHIAVPYEAMKEHLINTSYLPEGVITVNVPADDKYGWIWPDNGKVKIPNGTDSIIDRMFDSRYDIKTVFIPESITSIGKYAFRECTGIFVVPNDDVKKLLKYSGANTYQIYVKKQQNQWWIPLQGSIIIPEEVIAIPDGAFKRRSDITSVEIKSNCCIYKDAFAYCPNLQNVSIGGNINIMDTAFANCENLQHVHIENAEVLSINKSAFEHSDGCTFVVPSERMRTKLVKEGINEYITFVEGQKRQWWIPDENGKIVVPAHVEAINDRMFQDRINIKSVMIEDVVRSIEPYAFSGCNKLESITIPESIVFIDNLSFCELYKLKNIYVYSDFTKKCITQYLDEWKEIMIEVIENPEHKMKPIEKEMEKVIESGENREDQIPYFGENLFKANGSKSDSDYDENSPFENQRQGGLVSNPFDNSGMSFNPFARDDTPFTRDYPEFDNSDESEVTKKS